MIVQKVKQCKLTLLQPARVDFFFFFDNMGNIEGIYSRISDFSLRQFTLVRKELKFIWSKQI